VAKVLIGVKVGMTNVITSDGTAKAVTLVKAAPNIVSAVKTNDRDGYASIQLSQGQDKNISKPQAGQVKALKIKPKRVAEFRVEHELKTGDTIDVSTFAEGDVVKVTGISKGKGFSGTIKRHNFHRGPKTHGSRNYRKPGSIGSMYPQKVFKGKKMAGRMGAEQVTVRNLKVALIDAENEVIGISGAVPGPRRGTIKIEAI
jgi:large subunit ribosomal protein L3